MQTKIKKNLDFFADILTDKNKLDKIMGTKENDKVIFQINRILLIKFSIFY